MSPPTHHLFQCLTAVRTVQNLACLEEADHTVGFILQLSNFLKEWHFHLPQLLRDVQVGRTSCLHVPVLLNSACILALLCLHTIKHFCITLSLWLKQHESSNVTLTLTPCHLIVDPSKVHYP